MYRGPESWTLRKEAKFAVVVKIAGRKIGETTSSNEVVHLGIANIIEEFCGIVFGVDQ